MKNQPSLPTNDADRKLRMQDVIHRTPFSAQGLMAPHPPQFAGATTSAPGDSAKPTYAALYAEFPSRTKRIDLGQLTLDRTRDLLALIAAGRGETMDAVATFFAEPGYGKRLAYFFVEYERNPAARPGTLSKTGPLIAKKLLTRLKRTHDGLQPLDLRGAPEGFGPRLAWAMGCRGFGQASLGHKVGLPRTTIGNWVRGTALPGRQFYCYIIAIEQALGVPAGLLSNCAVFDQLRSVEAAAVRSTTAPTAASIASRLQREYRNKKPPIDFDRAPAALQAQLESFLDHRDREKFLDDRTLLAGCVDHFRGPATLADYRAILRRVFSYAIHEEHLPLETLDFTVLLDEERLVRFMAWAIEQAPAQRISGDLWSLLSVLQQELDAESGWFWQHPEIGGLERIDREVWNRRCIKARQEIAGAKDWLDAMSRHQLEDSSRHQRDPVQPIIDCGCAGVAAAYFLDQLRTAAAPHTGSFRDDIACRDYAIFSLALYFGLSATVLARLLLGDNISAENPGDPRTAIRIYATWHELGVDGHRCAGWPALDGRLPEAPYPGAPSAAQAMRDYLLDTRPRFIARASEATDRFTKVFLSAKGPVSEIGVLQIDERCHVLTRRHFGGLTPRGFGLNGFRLLAEHYFSALCDQDLARWARSPLGAILHHPVKEPNHGSPAFQSALNRIFILGFGTLDVGGPPRAQQVGDVACP